MTDQFDGFQLDPSAIGSDWVFSGQQATKNQAPGKTISNPQYHFVDARSSVDRTISVHSFDHQENPERVIGAGYLGWGVDWSMFNYNPYGKYEIDGKSPMFKVKNDYLLITGLGGLDVVSDDVMDKDEVEASGMSAYYNYPTEGYNSFGKKGDKEWAWSGNTWIPA